MQISDIDDLGIVTRTLLGEARGEGKEGMQAVANVIANRSAKPSWWGKDFRTVCLKPYQFSCWLASDPNRDKIIGFDESLPIYGIAEEIAQQAMNGELEDITNGAVNYYAKGIKPPMWALGKMPCAIIGHHLFFNNV